MRPSNSVSSTPHATVLSAAISPILPISVLRLCAIAGTAQGIYVTLNPVAPALLARAANHVIEWAKHTTSDADIQGRIWLPIDFDPVRPSGISSTDAEHTAALERAQACRGWLASLGWPQSVYADSGNGAHLLYRIDLPNDPPTTALLQQCLAALDL